MIAMHHTDVDEDDAPTGSRCRPDCRRPTASEAHCGVCHATMRTVTAFDAHRRAGHCLDPAGLGLVDVDGLWASPEGHAQRAQLAERLHEHRNGPSPVVPTASEPRTAPGRYDRTPGRDVTAGAA